MKNSGENKTIKLSKDLPGGVDRVPVNDPTFSDLAGVLTGMKPVTYTDCSPKRLPYLAELCRRLKLRTFLPEEFLDYKGGHFKRSKMMVLIGRDARDLKKAAAAWNRDKVSEDWGVLLGYPECCVRAYSEWRARALRERVELVDQIAARTRSSASLDFRLNNLWNYFSRMDFDDAEDCSLYNRFIELNREQDLPSLHVISWHPCSYDCAASGKKAGTIFSFMEHHAPGYAAALRTLLARPALFWDKFRYAFFKGEAGKARLAYNGVAGPRSLLDDKLYRLLELCDSVRFGKAGAVLYRGEKRMLKLPGRAPRLLAFGERENPRRTTYGRGRRASLDLRK